MKKKTEIDFIVLWWFIRREGGCVGSDEVEEARHIGEHMENDNGRESDAVKQAPEKI